MPVHVPENRGCPGLLPRQQAGAVRPRCRLRKGIAAILTGFLTILVASFPAPAKEPAKTSSFTYEDLVNLAGTAAQNPFEEPKELPDVLSSLSYDQWRSIRFKPEEALWRGKGLPFQVQFFHPGGLYNRLVEVAVVASGTVSDVPFSPSLFHYGTNDFEDKMPKDFGVAGFRLHYPLNTPKHVDEVVVFLGASYFRAVGREQLFGVSARGVAVDTALDSGEEFPYFKKFWLVRPEKDARTMTVLALLDSPSLTGAYRFVIKPGKETVMDTVATLFIRKKIEKLGLLPLTSMFFYGENHNIRPVDNFRPEIHDSDGLQINTDTGEWLWRPLIDPKRLLVTSFDLNNPKGFGLLQRDGYFDHYQDLEADYHRRPSIWITPAKDWGAGRVELVEIPTDSEKNDNIVAYWVPDEVPQPGGQLTFSYRLTWGSEQIAGSPLARVTATRTATDTAKEKEKTYLIDFQGGKLDTLDAEAKVAADLSAGGGEIVEHHLEKLGETKGWRLVFKVRKKEGALDQVTPGDGPPLELRAFLRQGDEVLTESWSYVDPF